MNFSVIYSDVVDRRGFVSSWQILENTRIERHDILFKEKKELFSITTLRNYDIVRRASSPRKNVKYLPISRKCISTRGESNNMLRIPTQLCAVVYKFFLFYVAS